MLQLKIQDFLSNTCHIEIDREYTIVVYDSSSTDVSVLPADNIVSILGTKCSLTFQRVRVLYGESVLPPYLTNLQYSLHISLIYSTTSVSH